MSARSSWSLQFSSVNSEHLENTVWILISKIVVTLQCPALFTYIVWQKGHFHLFPLTVGILSPLIFALPCCWSRLFLNKNCFYVKRSRLMKLLCCILTIQKSEVKIIRFLTVSGFWMVGFWIPIGQKIIISDARWLREARLWHKMVGSGHILQWGIFNKTLHVLVWYKQVAWWFK